MNLRSRVSRFFQSRFDWPYHDADVIVFTMGKVGSSSISASLKASGLLCLDVHSLSGDVILKRLRHQFQSPEKIRVPRHLIESLVAYNVIRNRPDNEKIRIVSLIRDPVRRNISAVFQNAPESLLGSPEKLLERLRNYDISIPDKWFTDDFGVATGIDIFSRDFARNNDHFRIENDRFDCLILKLEMPDNKKSELLGDFLGRRIRLRRENEASKKAYYDLYQSVIENPAAIRITFAQECANLRYFHKFYPEKERDHLTQAFLR